MNLRLSKTLKLWVDVACEQRKARNLGRSRRALTAEVLVEFERAGDAMRYLDRNGRIAWRASARMLNRLADAERDARDELDEWP
jgi:hypothetical protein